MAVLREAYELARPGERVQVASHVGVEAGEEQHEREETLHAEMLALPLVCELKGVAYSSYWFVHEPTEAEQQRAQDLAQRRDMTWQDIFSPRWWRL